MKYEIALRGGVSVSNWQTIGLQAFFAWRNRLLTVMPSSYAPQVLARIFLFFRTLDLPKTSIEYAIRSLYYSNIHTDKGFSRYIKVGPDRMASHFRCHGTFQECGWLSVTCSNVSSKHTAKNISSVQDIKTAHLPQSCAFQTPHRASIYIPSKLPLCRQLWQMWQHTATLILNDTRYMKVVSFKIRPLCPRKKSSQCPLKKKLHEPLSRSRRFGKEKISPPVENRTKNRRLPSM